MLGITRYRIEITNTTVDIMKLLSKLEIRLASDSTFRTKIKTVGMDGIGFKIQHANAVLPHGRGEFSCLDEIRIFADRLQPHCVDVEFIWKEYLLRMGLMVAVTLIFAVSIWPPGIGVVLFCLFGLLVMFGLVYGQIRVLRERVMAAISEIELAGLSSTRF